MTEDILLINIFEDFIVIVQFSEMITEKYPAYYVNNVRSFIFIGFIIPQRVVSALMAFSAVALAYMLRISLSYAITQMVSSPHAHENGSVILNPDVCPPYEDEIIAIENDEPIPTVNSVTTEKFYWSQELQGLILSSFYWGYILTHIPGGVLSAKIGGKYTLLFGVAIATIFTLFTPYAVLNGEKIITKLIMSISLLIHYLSF